MADFGNKNKDKKRILFVITQSEFGGAQRFLYETVTHLNREHFDLAVAIGATGDDQLSQMLEKSGIRVYRLRHLQRSIRTYGEVSAIMELRRIIKDYKPNTLFLNSSKTGVIGSLAAKTFRNIQVIYRIGGWSFNDPNPSIKQWFYKFSEQLFSPFKNIIIVNNQHDYDQALKFGIAKDNKLVLIYNGIDTTRLDFVEPSAARQFIIQKTGKQISDDTIIIGTIANFYPTKGLSYLLQSAAILKREHPETKLHFVIIGDGPERNKLEEMIAKEQLDNVSLIGRFEARQHIRAFDIYLLSSVKEGFPWVILEAMGAGIPVIATRVGALPEIIETGKNGILISPANPDSIAEEILKLSKDSSLRATLAASAHETVEKTFKEEDMIKKIEELL